MTLISAYIDLFIRVEMSEGKCPDTTVYNTACIYNVP